MKLCGILLLMIMFAPFAAQAQEKNMPVEVYLKDRSIVRGTIIEEIPQVSITLRTDDGNIVVYKMEEIEKYRQDYLQQKVYEGSTHTVTKKTSGYRGFVEVGFSFGSEVYRLEITTSHGYQILPYLFTGIGTGILRGCDWSENAKNAWYIPIFADVRYDILKKPLTPFIDLKIGGTVGDGTGFYMSPSIGCRFPIYGTIGLNVRLGYTLQRVYIIKWHGDWVDESGRWHENYRTNKYPYRGAFTATVGVDF